MKRAEREISLRGFTPSAGSWEDEDLVCAFSRETVPGTYGHPRFEIQIRKADGRTVQSPA